VFCCLHGSAPSYLASDLQHVSDLNTRRRLRSSSTLALVTPRTLRATIGDHAFPAAAASVWNSLPESVRALPSLPVFRSRLKTVLFARSYSRSVTMNSASSILRAVFILLHVLAVFGLCVTLKTFHSSSSSSPSSSSSLLYNHL